jgi:DNA repair protein RAD5
MNSKEAYEQSDGDIDMRTMHPLWEEYEFPKECVGEHRFFYFNPYNGKAAKFYASEKDSGKLTFLLGELSLEFPEANSQEKGGILADGK